MKLVGQGLSCVHKLLTFPSQSHLSVRTFSSVCRVRNKQRELSTPVSYLDSCGTIRKCSNVFNFRCWNIRCASLAVYRSGSYYCGGKFHTKRFITPLHTSASTYVTIPTQSSTITDTTMSHSALQVKRPMRKRLPADSHERKTMQIDNVVAYAVAEDIDLPSLEKSVLKQDLYSIGSLPQDVTYALHVRGKYNLEQKSKEIFVFEDGCVIFWCVPEMERGAFLKMLGKFSQGPYASSLMLYEKEEIDFTFSSGKTSLVGDMIHLNEGNGDSPQRHLDMYAFSNAMATSVKLAMWEASFNKFVSSIENVTEDLRKGHKISMSRQQVLMKTGELFSLRHQINLSSDLLDTPDFYWDREALEPLYVSLCNYLSISRRTKVINQKLNHCCELTELLSSQLNDAHHTRLEWMIIILIMVEVVFEIVHSVEKYWTKLALEKVNQLADAEIIKESGNMLPQ